MKTEDDLPQLLRRMAESESPRPDAWSRFQNRRKLAAIRRSVALSAAAAVIATAGITLPRLLATGTERALPVEQVPSPSPSAPENSEPIPPSEQSTLASNWRSKAVVYGVYEPHNDVNPPQEPGIWYYDPTSGETSLLAALPEGKIYRSPRFRNAREISFISLDRMEGRNNSLELLDVGSREKRALFSPATASLLDCDWRPDGNFVACIEADYTKDSTHKVVIHDVAHGSERTVRPLGVPAGTDCCEDGEVSLTWSKDGMSLLVVDTHVVEIVDGSRIEPIDGIHIIDTHGNDVIKPLRGTQARWSPDERFLYFREWERLGNAGQWIRSELNTGERTPLEMRSKAYHATLSPDGRYLAYSYDKGPEDRNLLYVYDIKEGVDRRIASGYQYPIWVRPRVIAATRVAECKAGTSGCMVVEGWLGRGAWSIPMAGAEPTHLNLGSTLFGSVDVLYE